MLFFHATTVDKRDEKGSPADWETSEQLVLERLGLSDGAQTTRGDLLGVELDGVVVKVEALLHDRGELADAAALLAQHLLGLGGQDDDLGAGGGDADLDARVAVLGQLSGEECVQLGLEDTAAHELFVFEQAE
jgi:hypothetical protein